MNIGIIVLAAGSSSRMGKPKQLLDIRGVPLLVKTIQAALQSKAGSVTIVLGSNDAMHREVISNLNIDIVENTTWQQGMGNSLKAGLNHLLSKNPMLNAVIIMVCDQPSITADHLNDLIDTYVSNKRSIVASYYSNAPGVPALIDKKIFRELLSIHDSHGAKKIILQHPDETDLINFPSGAIDLDTPEDYTNYLERK